MRRHWKIFGIALLVVTAAVISFLVRDPEPHYRGRSLSEWYSLWNNSLEYDDPQSQSQAKEAAEAIRAIGTNAIPVLLKRLRQDPSPVLAKLAAHVADKVPDSLLERGPIHDLFSTRKGVEPASTFAILGPLASPAVPELTELLRATNINPEISRSAAYSLLRIGKDGLPPLLDALTAPDQRCSYFASEIFAWVRLTGTNLSFGTNLTLAVPLLAKNALNTNALLAQVSIKALGALRLQPQIAIPALIKCMDSTDSLSRVTAVSSLARFEFEAVSPLRKALNHPDINVRDAATNHLRNLAPQYLTNAPAS